MLHQQSMGSPYFQQILVHILILNFLFCEAFCIFTQETFKAAVLDKGNLTYYMNDTIPTRQEALQLVQPHLQLYEQAAQGASKEVRR